LPKVKVIVVSVFCRAILGTMNRSLLALASFASAFCTFAAAQVHATPPRDRSVSLDTVLACPADEVVQEVFNTDLLTADRLNAVAMTLMARTDDKYLSLKTKGFVTVAGDEYKHFEIMPTDYSGKWITESRLPFCRSRPTASYGRSNDGPDLVEIDGKGWSLNPNEIFVHADQFQFESGVFSDSAGVFLTATKGRASMQFLCTPNGLKLYRVLYKQKNRAGGEPDHLTRGERMRP
jgi:hypothetical protein